MPSILIYLGALRGDKEEGRKVWERKNMKVYYLAVSVSSTPKVALYEKVCAYKAPMRRVTNGYMPIEEFVKFAKHYLGLTQEQIRKILNEIACKLDQFKKKLTQVLDKAEEVVIETREGVYALVISLFREEFGGLIPRTYEEFKRLRKWLKRKKKRRR